MSNQPERLDQGEVFFASLSVEIIHFRVLVRPFFSPTMCDRVSSRR